MATAAELKARLVLEAEARGAGEFEALASELEALAREGGAAAPKFEALAQSLRDVGAQDQLISDFAALRRQAAERGLKGPQIAQVIHEARVKAVVAAL